VHVHLHGDLVHLHAVHVHLHGDLVDLLAIHVHSFAGPAHPSAGRANCSFRGSVRPLLNPIEARRVCAD
jgi:hypothetical protein